MSYTVHLLPPDYPQQLHPFTCPHRPQFHMMAGGIVVKHKVEIDSLLCMACGKPLAASYGGNVFSCITECLGSDHGMNAKIAEHLRYLSARYLRVASRLFGPNGWTGWHRRWAEMIDPNLTMRISPAGAYADGTRFFRVNVDESYFSRKEATAMPTYSSAPIADRIEMIEDALAKVLDRSACMSVEIGDCPGTRALYVCEGTWDGAGRERHDLYQMAREIERLLP